MEQIQSIMKEQFSLDNVEKFNVNIDATKPAGFNVYKFLSALKRYRGTGYKKGDIWESLITFGYGEAVELKDATEEEEKELVNISRSMKQSSRDSFIVYKMKEGKDKERTTYICISLENSVTRTKQAKSYYLRNSYGARNYFEWYNIKELVVVNDMVSLLDEEDRKALIERARSWSISFKERDDEETYRIVVKYLINSLLRGKSDKSSYYTATNLHTYKYLLEKLMVVYDKELNIRLMTNYGNELTGEYATAYQTKKNIPKKIQKAMVESEFRKQGFDFVEYDADSDLNKIALVEQEWRRIYKQLPKTEGKLDLRLRKLGNYRASGVYFPYYSCIAVDLRAIHSFIHEYAHHLDYTYEDKTMSLQDDFLPIIRKYRENYDKLKPKVTPKMKAYYRTPTEIFARGYEVYKIQEGLNTSLLGKPERFKGREEYEAIIKDKGLMALVNEYYRSKGF